VTSYGEEQPHTPHQAGGSLGFISEERALCPAAQVGALALLLTCCVTWGKSLGLSVLSS
jgi:hypothetical protein